MKFNKEFCKAFLCNAVSLISFLTVMVFLITYEIGAEQMENLIFGAAVVSIFTVIVLSVVWFFGFRLKKDDHDRSECYNDLDENLNKCELEED